MVRFDRVSIINREEFMDLIWKTFVICNASDYSEQGRLSFYEYIHNERLFEKSDIIGAYEGETLVGVLAFVNAHIQLFFVDPSKQGQGIGKQLFACALKISKSNFFTVNSSLYAIVIYERLGFQALGRLRESGGLITLPMIYTK